MILKNTRKLLSFVVILAVSFFMLACDKETTATSQMTDNNITTNNETTVNSTEEVVELQRKLQFIYDLAVDSESFDGTYEEWLETVKGPKGEDGENISIQVANGYVQWQYVGDAEWNNLVELSSLVGTNGVDGRETTFRVTDSYIQWQYVGETSWTNLIELTTLAGPVGTDGSNGTNGVDGADGADGREVTFQVANGYIQWQYVGDTTWTNIIELATLVDSSGNDVPVVSSEHSPTIYGAKDTIYYEIDSDEFDILEGVTAIDPKYGDITQMIEVSIEQVKYWEVGVYDVTYSVTNYDGYSDVVHFDFVVTFNDDVPLVPDEFVIVENEYYGLLSITGEVLLEEEFDYISYYGDRMLHCEKEGEEFFYDLDSQTYIQYDYEVYSYFNEGLVYVYNDYLDSLGYMDKSGEIVIPFKFSRAQSFYDGRAIVEMGDNVGVIDIFGNAIIDIKYESIYGLPNGYFLTEIDDEFAVKNNMGEDVLIVSSSYFDWFELDDGTMYFQVEIDGHYGIVNELFVEVIAADYIAIDQIDNDFFYCDSIYGSANIWNSTSRKNLFNVHDLIISDGLYLIQVKEFVDVDAKYGIYDPETETYLLAPLYKELEPLNFGEGLYIATNFDDMKGIIDKNGTILTDFVIEEIYFYNAENFFVYEDSAGLLGTIAIYGEIAEVAAYSEIIDSEIYTRMVINSDGLYGFIDEYGLETINPQYFDAENFSEDLALVKTLDELFGWTYVSLNGTPITTETYKSGSDFSNGLAVVQVEDQNGEEAYKLISNLGVELTDVAYRVISPNENGYSAVIDTPENNLYGMINELGELIVPCDYSTVDHPSSGMIRVINSDGLYGFYNIQGDLVIGATLFSAHPFSNNLAIVENENGQQGIIDNTGTLVMDYDDVVMSYFTSSVVAYKEIGGDLYGLLNKYGTVICEPTYYYIGIFANDLAPAKLNNGDDYGYINTNGQMVIEATYSSARRFHETIPFGIVQESFYYGLIDTDGEYVFEPLYYDIYETENGFVVDDGDDFCVEVEYTDGKLSYLIEGANHIYYTAVYDDGWRLYDGTTLVVDKAYVTFSHDEESGLWLVSKNGLYGLLDSEFNEIVAPQYDKISISNRDEFIYVEINDDHGILSRTGDVIVPAIYDGVSKQRNGYMFTVYVGDFMGLYSVEDGMIVPVQYLYLVAINSSATAEDGGMEEIPQ